MSTNRRPCPSALRVLGLLVVALALIAYKLLWPSVTSSLESLAVLRNKRLNRHRRPATDPLDQLVTACEDAVGVVDCDLAQMLYKEFATWPARDAIGFCVK